MRRTYELQDIIDHVLPMVGMSDEDSRVYSEYARAKYLPLRFSLAARMGDIETAKGIKRELDEAEGRSRKRDLILLACETRLGRAAYLIGRGAKLALLDARNLLMGRK